jgi:hypothetical protein
MVDVQLSEMVSMDIPLLNILIHTACNKSCGTAVCFACMLFVPAALLFLMLFYAWWKGLRLGWSHLFAILWLCNPYLASYRSSLLLPVLGSHVGIVVAKL